MKNAFSFWILFCIANFHVESDEIMYFRFVTEIFMNTRRCSRIFDNAGSV